MRRQEEVAARRSVALGLAVFLAMGCASKKHVAAPPAVTPEGKTTYAYIFDPANPALTLAEDTKLFKPRQLEPKTLPSYPGSALAAHDGPHRELVRIVVDTHGRVSQVLESPMGRSDEGPFAADYRRAVDAAVRTWRYEPGELRRFAPGNDLDGDGKPDYKVMTSHDPIAVYYDVRFTFEIVDGKGVVHEEGR